MVRLLFFFVIVGLELSFLTGYALSRGSHGYSSCHGSHCGWTILSGIAAVLLLGILWYLGKFSWLITRDGILNREGKSILLGLGSVAVCIALLTGSIFFGPLVVKFFSRFGVP